MALTAPTHAEAASATPVVVIAAVSPTTRELAVSWATAVGARPEVVDSAAAVRRSWADATAIMVDAVTARELAISGVVRRPHVLVVDAATDGDEVWRSAVAIGATHVCRPSADDQAGALDELAAALDGRGDACVVAVVGAVGGVGASSFAVQLAQAGASRRWRTVVGDLDPAGGIDLVLGADRAEGARWDTLDVAGGRLPAGALMDVLPRHGDLAFLTVSRETSLAAADPVPVIGAARRAADLVVLDVPRHPASLDVVAHAELTVILVPEDVRGVAAARHLLGGLEGRAGTVVAVGRGVRGGLGKRGLVEHLKVPVVGHLRWRPSLARDVASARGPRASRAERRVAADVLGLVGLNGARR